MPYWGLWCLCDGLSLGGQSSGNCLSSHSPVTVSMTGMTKERNPCRDSQRPQLPWCELKTAVTRSFMHDWRTRACPRCPIWITEQGRREHSQWGGNRSFPRTDGPQGHPLCQVPQETGQVQTLGTQSPQTAVMGNVEQGSSWREGESSFWYSKTPLQAMWPEGCTRA